MTDERVVKILTAFYERGIVMFGRDSDIERMLVELQDEQSESQEKSTEDKLTLKPCPFCDSEAIAWERSFPHVRCSSKDCEVALFDETIEKAIEKWNRRARE